MRKRILLIAASLCFFFSLFFPISASGSYVIDEAGVLSSDELQELNRKAELISEELECGVYVIFTGSMKGYSDSQFAKGIYVNYSLGWGNGKSGVLLAICTDPGYEDCTAYGAAADVFTTSQLDDLNDLVMESLYSRDWYSAAESFINESESVLRSSGYTYYEPEYTDPEIDARTAQTTPEQRRQEWLNTLPLTALISLAIALIIAFAMRSQLKTTGRKREAKNYISRNGMHLTAMHDYFMYRQTSRTRIPRNNGSGSGGGGGGYHSSGFSSSSGGNHF